MTKSQKKFINGSQVIKDQKEDEDEDEEPQNSRCIEARQRMILSGTAKTENSGGRW